MLRRFRQHDLRYVDDLRGVWDFAFLGDMDPDAVDVAAIAFADRIAVPGCFDATPAYAGQRGLAAYRTVVPVRDDTPHRLILDGVHHWARIFINGQPRRDHVGGFTRFATAATDLPLGLAEVVVLVDNRIDYDRCPLHLDYFDWYHYGGIARGGEWHRLGDCWIDTLTVTTTDWAKRKVAVHVAYGAIEPIGETDLVIACDGQTVHRQTIDVTDTSGTLDVTVTLPDAALWSPAQPNLHEIHVGLADDDMRERIGIRQVRIDGQRILINDEPVRLLGFCRHEAHPQFGHGLPDAMMVADVQQLRDMGCNFVRGSHYPQDVRFLDLCDEAGICVWNEAIGWNHTVEHLTDPNFITAQLTHIDEMVAAAINRPSVIMWGILNESVSEAPDAKPSYAALLGRLRELDPSRPVTYASSHPFDDICFDLCDIVSINCYPGWYQGTLDDIPTHLDKLIDHVKDAGFGDKPLIISEIGAGAVPGWRDNHGSLWTEQYQADLLDVTIRHMFVDRDRFAGLAIWQFGDCRTSDDSRIRMLGRPRGFNNKGVVDEYRRPKMAYAVVKQLFGSLQ